MTFAISPAGLTLVKSHEGFRAEPAHLPDGNWVVGYGHLRVGEPGENVSEADAENLLTIDVACFERLVNAHVTARLAQPQFDALVSFAMSVGAEAFAQSQVLRRVNNAEHIAAACALDAWRKSDVGGELEIVDALVRRRAAEKALYLEGVEAKAQPSAFLRAKLDHAALVLGAPVAYAPAREVGSIPVAQPKAEPAQILTEILKSEPATEVLLLTQLAEEAAPESDDEIVTAHAKPAARKTFIKRTPARAQQQAPVRFGFSQPFETVGLLALLAFGIGLSLIGGSMLLEAGGDVVSMLGGSAIAAPGIAAVLLAGVGLKRGPARAAARG